MPRRKIGMAEASEILGIKPRELFDMARANQIDYVQYGPEGCMLFYEDKMLEYREEKNKEKDSIVREVWKKIASVEDTLVRAKKSGGIMSNPENFRGVKHLMSNMHVIFI